MRVIGLDLGSRRVGVAVGDTRTGVATALEVWPRRDAVPLPRRLGDCVAEWEAELVVVGLPRSLDGSEGAAAHAVREVVTELRAHLEVPVELYDERFSTVTAQDALHRGGLDTRKSRKVIDAVAAAVILQGWLDAHAEAS